MCTRTTCRTCGKPTVSGCGQHVDQALRGVPKADRCMGHARTSSTPTTSGQKSGGFFSRLFGGE